ncbi:MAG: hypothetical protein ABH854_05570 [Candidatus Diapherotrites archaeon]|nr:hypothetical protein [Candidatus Micrarchaeota archaeon]MBU1940073.1 hypothetical protein [Candidatus Micrarchaeota archaeon]
MLCKKGQVTALDFMFGLFLFLFIAAWLFSIWSSNLGVAITEQGFEQMRGKAFQAMDVLVRTGGTPPDWEGGAEGGWGDGEMDGIVSLGLASKDRVMMPDKLSAFILAGDPSLNDMRDYNRTKVIFGIMQYDYFFKLKTLDPVQTFETGLAPGAAATAVAVERTVMYEGGEAIATFTIHYEFD